MNKTTKRAGRPSEALQPPIADGRVPPHDLDAEAAVLSAILLSRDALDRVLEILTPEHFYSDANKRIFEAAQELALAGTVIDLVSVASWLRDRERLAQIGGPSYLAQLSDATPAVAHVEVHARVVLKLWRRREASAYHWKRAAESYFAIDDDAAWFDESEAELHALAMGSAPDTATTLKRAVKTVIERLHSREVTPAVLSGLADVDRLTKGFRPGELVVVGAWSECGKSVLAEQIVTTAAIQGDRDLVLFITAEMKHDEFAERALFREARVNFSKVAEPETIEPMEEKRLTDAAVHLSLDNVILDDRASVTPMQIRSRARAVQAEARRQKKKLALVAIDYLQLIVGADVDSREQQVAGISRALKMLAMELGVPVLVTSQLNKDGLKRSDQRPRSSDLRESAAIWHDADKVLLIYAPAAIERSRSEGPPLDGGDCPPELAEIIVDKARGRGAVKGKRRVLFFPSHVRFANLSTRDAERAVNLLDGPAEGPKASAGSPRLQAARAALGAPPNGGAR